MSSPLISIIMPAKNTARYIDACIHSIRQQDYTNWELIVVNDHSTDNTAELITQHQVIDARIQLHHNIKTGIINALQLGYQHAKGQYITRMDADDIMSTDKLSRFLTALQTNGAQHVAVGYVKYFSDGQLRAGYVQYAAWLNSLTATRTNFKDIYRECTIPSPSWMMLKTDFYACGGFSNDVYPEDYDLAFRFRKAGYKIAPIHKTIHYWRDYGDRTSRTDSNYADNRFMALKVMHFVDQDYDNSHTLLLWGTGKKGKTIAQHLIEHDVTFTWICNNTKKIGKDIYGQKIQALSTLQESEDHQVIVSISSQHAFNEIDQLIRANPSLCFFRFS